MQEVLGGGKASGSQEFSNTHHKRCTFVPTDNQVKVPDQGESSEPMAEPAAQFLNKITGRIPVAMRSFLSDSTVFSTPFLVFIFLKHISPSVLLCFNFLELI